MAKNQQELLDEIAELQLEAAAEPWTTEQAIAAGTASDDPDIILVRSTDTWATIAARLGVSAEALYEANQGVGGCATMQSIPVGARLNRPE